MELRKSKIIFCYPALYGGSNMDKFINQLRSVAEVEIWYDYLLDDINEERYSKFAVAIREADYYLYIYNAYGQAELADFGVHAALGEELGTQLPKLINIQVGIEGNNYEPLFLTFPKVVFKLGYFDTEDVEELYNYIKINSSQRLLLLDSSVGNGQEGIIKIASQVNAKLIQYLSQNPVTFHNIDRRLFEEVIAEIFCGFGFIVELTQKTRDGGRDIIAIKNSITHLKYLIECKRPNFGNMVGVKPVRELFGVKNDEKATKGILATTTFFTPDAKLYFERNRWELDLKDYHGLQDWIAEYKRVRNLI